MLATQTLTHTVGVGTLGGMANQKASGMLRSLRALGKGSLESKANRTQGPPRQFSLMVTGDSFLQGQCSPPMRPLSLPHTVKGTGDSMLVTASSRKQCLCELKKQPHQCLGLSLLPDPRRHSKRRASVFAMGSVGRESRLGSRGDYYTLPLFL